MTPVHHPTIPNYRVLVADEEAARWAARGWRVERTETDPAPVVFDDDAPENSEE